jgi:hypothetical protein
VANTFGLYTDHQRFVKKLKRRLTWQWGQAGEDILVEANNGGGCGVPRSESHTVAM